MALKEALQGLPAGEQNSDVKSRITTYAASLIDVLEGRNGHILIGIQSASGEFLQDQNHDIPAARKAAYLLLKEELNLDEHVNYFDFPHAIKIYKSINQPQILLYEETELDESNQPKQTKLILINRNGTELKFDDDALRQRRY